jgi:hypothetical protein
MALAGPGKNPADALAELGSSWDYLTPGQQEAEETGARAAIDSDGSSGTPAPDASARALAVAKAALSRLANCDYNPDTPGEQTFEIAEDALARIAGLDQ